MTVLWTELQTLWHMYISLATRFIWVFMLAVFIAALLTTYRLDRRVVPYFQSRGFWAYAGAILLGVVSPF